MILWPESPHVTHHHHSHSSVQNLVTWPPFTAGGQWGGWEIESSHVPGKEGSWTWVGNWQNLPHKALKTSNLHTLLDPPP